MAFHAVKYDRKDINMRLEVAFYTKDGILIATDNVMITQIPIKDIKRDKYLHRAIDKLGTDNLINAQLAIICINGKLESSSMHFMA